MTMNRRRTWRWNLAGWMLFIVSAVFFTISAVRSGGTIEVVASLSFLVACLVFMAPLVISGPGD